MLSMMMMVMMVTTTTILIIFPTWMVLCANYILTLSICSDYFTVQ